MKTQDNVFTTFAVNTYTPDGGLSMWLTAGVAALVIMFFISTPVRKAIHNIYATICALLFVTTYVLFNWVPPSIRGKLAKHEIEQAIAQGLPVPGYQPKLSDFKDGAAYAALKVLGGERITVTRSSAVRGTSGKTEAARRTKPRCCVCADVSSPHSLASSKFPVCQRHLDFLHDGGYVMLGFADCGTRTPNKGTPRTGTSVMLGKTAAALLLTPNSRGGPINSDPTKNFAVVSGRGLQDFTELLEPLATERSSPRPGVTDLLLPHNPEA